MMALFIPLFAMLFPINDLAIFIYLIFMILRNALGHSGYEVFPSGFSRSALGWNNTVTHHDLHHQVGRYNFGLYFTWWDRWMATEHPEYHKKFEQNAVHYRAVTKPVAAVIPED